MTLQGEVRVWRCIICRTARTTVAARMLDPRYAEAPCFTCRKVQVFRLHEEPTEGEALKADGIRKVTDHAEAGIDAAWRVQAAAVARQLAATGQSFTQDDITDRCGLPTVRNATGGLLSGLARQGVIERVGDTKGSRDSQHARRISVWRGKATLFGDAA